MKQHIRLKLKQDVGLRELAHWENFLDDKTHAITTIHSVIDTLFAKYRLPIWVTREYKPAGQTWNQGELIHGLNRVYRLILQEDTNIPPQLIQEISVQPIVEEVKIGEVVSVPLPSPRAAAMSAETDWQSRQAIYLEAAHQYTQGDPNIVVAVLDTGINLAHPEYQDSLLPGYDFVDIIDGAGKFVGDFLGADDVPDDEVGHGTHVTGIIGGKGLGMPVGVVPKCKILPVRVLGAMEKNGRRVGAGLVDNINAGIKWAVDQGVQVINMSLGIPHTGGGLPHEEVVNYAQEKGVTIVAASGNDGQEQLYYPGALPHVIAVGAIDETGAIAKFSTYGKQVSLVAPGTNIYSTYLHNEYSFSTGTSHASPFVAGAVALLKSYALKKRGKTISDEQVKHILKHTSDKISTQFKHRRAGFGKLNLIDALQLLDYKLSS
ncbi:MULTISPECIES: S8 family peptidase [unclassified Tolypothrix]|uniref:S8 family peptidase n=1 Tax=unclassified Tolypothrix TaxID=2649714 RepID=UPI0005EABF0E|nr:MULTISPECIES: S8 family serine peptidase [unclassified Tolypothrix]BAY95251.1 peptidase [Microchaete diplosiphon NIES-3275]EKE98126.1 peptidase families S8 and S53 [Tolypothrix sp. PCC 7601]MBE9086001.1 S8 family serine peptidase [Tolypothrix sp. LEGE 11397]UYD30476.1 S8 family serine peptidase [Tolypothrix sp. PCC 7712]UYD38390.1 S8 family serine peptidase [Tolypothrix sp. PCC 7601]